MSVIDIILDNQIILITLGLAALPLIAAVLLFTTPRLREKMAQIKDARQQARIEKEKLAARQKARAKARAKQAHARRKSKSTSSKSVPQDAIDNEDDYDDDDDEYYEDDDESESTAERHVKVKAEVTAADEVEEDEDDGEEDDESGEDSEISDEMQSLLSDVFVDEEANARMEVLLSDTVEIEVTDLLELSNQVADKLGAKSPTAY